jgi:hypothetical protein
VPQLLVSELLTNFSPDLKEATDISFLTLLAWHFGQLIADD